MWSVNADVHIDVAYHIARHFRHVSHQTAGPICVGGLVTPIAAYYNIELSRYDTAMGPTSLTAASLQQMGIINRIGGRIVFMFRDGTGLYLPDPSVTSHPESYRPTADYDPANPHGSTDNDENDETHESDEIAEHGEDDADDGNAASVGEGGAHEATSRGDEPPPQRRRRSRDERDDVGHIPPQERLAPPPYRSYSERFDAIDLELTAIRQTQTDMQQQFADIQSSLAAQREEHSAAMSSIQRMMENFFSSNIPPGHPSYPPPPPPADV